MESAQEEITGPLEAARTKLAEVEQGADTHDTYLQLTQEYVPSVAEGGNANKAECMTDTS